MHGNAQELLVLGAAVKWDAMFATKPGNYTKGSERPNSKSTEHDVALIKALLAEGVKQALIGSKFGLSARYINSIAKGRTWKHVEAAQ